MSSAYNIIQEIAEGHEAENRLSAYYEGTLYDAIEFLTDLVWSIEDAQFMDFHSLETAKKAANAIKILNDYQLLITKLESSANRERSVKQ